MTPPQVCPDESILREYLQEQLAAADSERIDDHIGGCPACQRALDRLVGSLPGRWLPDPDGAEGDALLTHVATALLGVMPRALVSAIEPGGPDRPVASTGSPGMTAAPDAEARIHLFGEIARGGMGAILKGRDVALGRDLAVKILLNRHRHNPVLVRRFVMEARIAGQLQHPGTVPIHELGTLDDGRPYFAMKLVKGRTLAALLKERTDPSQNRARLLGIFEQTCQTVAYAHARGIIHRDLKPANVMVGRFGEVQVMDWGLAKVLAGTDVDAAEDDGGDVAFDNARDDGGDLTNPGSVLGTWPYMAPEQARGLVAEVDRRSDVFGLGGILCEILTGGPPYIGPDSMSVRLQAMEGRPDEVSARLGGCGADSELIQLARRCLAPNPADRPANGGEVASAVAAYLSGVQERLQQERVARERQEDRAAEGRRRHRILVAATLSVSLTLALGVVASTIFALRERAARQKAGQEAFRATQSEQAALEAAVSEQAARETAEARQAETQAVLGFVQDRIFVAAQPEGRPGGLGREVSLRRAVEAALPFVDRGFGEQPLTEARLRMALGTSFYSLGEPKIAAEQWERARTLYTSRLGADHRDTPKSTGNLAIAYYELGRRDDALKLREEALALQRATLGPEHLETLDGMNDLAGSYTSAGRYADALELLEETLALRKAKLGPEDPATLTTSYNLARAYAALGRTAKAVTLHEETLALRKTKLGLTHPDTFWSMTNLAAAYASLGRHTDASQLHQETYDLQRVQLGPDHPDTLASMNNLALSHAALGRLADALELLEAAEALQEAKLEAGHPRTLMMMYNLACVHALMIPGSTDGAKHGDLAVGWLRKAVAAGFKDVAGLKQDKDLDALRDRADFRKLVSDLERAGK
jgi:eukaryotic-like serine/threonine-protein kinase